MAKSLWTLVLEIMLVVAATDLAGFPAFILLGFAKFLATIGIPALLLGLLIANMG